VGARGSEVGLEVGEGAGGLFLSLLELCIHSYIPSQAGVFEGRQETSWKQC
jgi:hypothetical protein